MKKKRPIVRSGSADKELVDHCSKMQFTVCAICGSSDVDRIDHIRRVGRCRDKNCRGTQNGWRRGNQTVPLAPSMQTIYGNSEESNIPSITEIMRKILAKRPRNEVPDQEYVPREWRIGYE